MERLRILILMCSFCALACQRDMAKDRSSIVIKVPDAQNLSNKTGGVGAMSAMPTNQKACYGINVTGVGISGSAATCGPKSGILAGFVEPGGTIEVSVPKGAGRKIELYAYLEPVGVNQSCPQLGASLPASQLLSTYLVGEATNVDLSSDTADVYITASFPGTSNNLASTLALPTTCTAGATPTSNPPGFQVSSGQMVASDGSTLKLFGRIGTPAGGSTLAVGSGLQIKKK